MCLHSQVELVTQSSPFLRAGWVWKPGCEIEGRHCSLSYNKDYASMSFNEENEGSLNRYVRLAAGNFWQRAGFLQPVAAQVSSARWSGATSHPPPTDLLKPNEQFTFFHNKGQNLRTIASLKELPLGPKTQNVYL